MCKVLGVVWSFFFFFFFNYDEALLLESNGNKPQAFFLSFSRRMVRRVLKPFLLSIRFWRECDSSG